MSLEVVPLSEVQRIRSTLVTWVGLTLAVLGPLVVMVSPFAVSLASGAVLAVLCYPLYARLRRRLPRWASAGIVTLGVVLGVLVPVILLLVGAFRQGAEALGDFSRDDAPTLAEAIETVRGWVPFTDSLGTPDEIRAVIQQGVTTASTAASGMLFTLAQGIPALVLQLVIVVLSTYFLLVDGRRLLGWIAGKLPLSLHIRTALVASFRGATSAVVLASVAAAATQAACLLVGFLVLGVPSALFAGGAAFVLAWVPTVGTVPVWASGAIYLYLHDSPVRAVVMVVIGLVVGLVDNVVRPLVLRGRQEMHPMVSLLAVIGGLAMLGVPGLFLGPLIASMAIAVLEIWPAVASYCGIPVTDAGGSVPEVPMIERP